MKRTTNTARLFTRCLGPASLAVLALAACSNDSSSTTTVGSPLPPRIAVTSVKGDPQSQLMAAIYARILEDSGFRVARKDPVELDRAGYYQALQDGQFQLIPELSGDLLSFVYSLPDAEPSPTTLVPAAPATTQAPIIVTTTTLPATTTTLDPSVSTTTGDTTADTTADTTPAATSTTVADTITTETGVPETSTSVGAGTTIAGETTTTTTVPSNGRSILEQIVALNAGLPTSLVVNNGSLAEDKQVIACTATAMTANSGFQLVNLTELASIAPGIRLGGSAAFLDDDELGYPAFLQLYGGEFKATVPVEDAELADAVANDSADCFAMNSLNPLITTERMQILNDDRTLVPSNTVIGLAASTVMTPEAIAALDSISISLTTERLNQMLNQINANGADPVVVANAFVDTL